MRALYPAQSPYAGLFSTRGAFVLGSGLADGQERCPQRNNDSRAALSFRRALPGPSLKGARWPRVRSCPRGAFCLIADALLVEDPQDAIRVWLDEDAVTVDEGTALSSWLRHNGYTLRHYLTGYDAARISGARARFRRTPIWSPRRDGRAGLGG